MKEGHRQNQCTLKQNAATFKEGITDGWTNWKAASGNYAEIEDRSHGTEIHGFAAISETGSVSWLIDSGASHHLTGNKQVFRDFRSLPKPIPVQVANGTKCLATGSGSIHFQLDCGLLTVKALYVPDFGAVSLISADALNDSGLEVIFHPGSCQSSRAPWRSSALKNGKPDLGRAPCSAPCWPKRRPIAQSRPRRHQKISTLGTGNSRI